MSSHGAHFQSPLENKRLNLIPVGRQLQRTPPNKSPNLQTTRTSEEPANKEKDDSQNVPQDDTICPSIDEESKSSRRSSVTPASAEMENADPDTFIQGMQGYHWTDADLEFVYQAKQQKRAQQLKQDLSEVEKTLQTESQRLELAIASRDQLQSELSKTLSCHLLLQLCKSVLSHSRTSDQLDGLGNKALLSLLKLQDVQQSVREEKAQISRLKKEAQELREKEDKSLKEMETCRKKINILQTNIDALKVELVELKTQLLEKEASVVSQAPAKVCKASRRGKPSTKALREEALKETAGKNMTSVEEADKDTAKEGKAAPKKNAPKKMTSKKNAKNSSSEKMAPVETDLEKKLLKPKFSNVDEVHEKGRKGSIIAKTLTMASKDNVHKKTALRDSKEKEMVPLEVADQEMAEKGETAPKKKALKNLTSKIIPKKHLAPDETVLQLKSPEETAPDELASEVLSPKVKAKLSTATVTEKVLKKPALRKTSEKQTAQIETDKKCKTARKVKAPKKGSSKNTAEKEMAPNEMASQVKTLNENVLEEMVSKVQAQKMKNSKITDEGVIALKDTVSKVKALEETSLEGTAVKASKLKAPKKTTSKTDVKMPTKLTVEGTMVTKKITLKVRGPKKTTSKQKDLREMDMQETAEDENALKETVLKRGLKEASKKETSVKNKVKEETDPDETASEKMALKEVDEETTSRATARKKTATKAKAPKEMPEKERTLKETVLRKRASKEKAPKQKAGMKPRDDEIHIDENFDQPSETKNFSNAAQAPGRAQKSVTHPESPAESEPEKIRRSKRNIVKNPSNTIPERTTRSRRR